MLWKHSGYSAVGTAAAAFVVVASIALIHTAQAYSYTPAPFAFNWTDYTTPVRPDSAVYDRCKVTHRCNRAFGIYDVPQARYNFTKQVFTDGLRQPVDLFLDFENWESGTAGLYADQTYLSRHPGATGAHFSSFDFPLMGTMYINQSVSILYNTSEVSMTLAASNCSLWRATGQTGRTSTPSHAAHAFAAARHQSVCFVWPGIISKTPKLQVEVAVFNYASLYWGPPVNVTLTGIRPLAILSRSSIVIDTGLIAPPGQLGVRLIGTVVFDCNAASCVAQGFLGSLTAAPNGTNINGPGSGSKRVYLHTITTGGVYVGEIQVITTNATAGQTLGGTFTLEYKGAITHPISHDATPGEVKARIESSLPLAGTVRVSRSTPDDQGGYQWRVTFVSVPGNIPQMKAYSQLSSLGAAVRVETVRDGNTIGGHFYVQFGGRETRPIPANATAKQLQDILEQDLPAVSTAHVVRNDPTGLCENGLCSNGPLPAWGYRYAITIATDMGNAVPFSPLSPQFTQRLPAAPATVRSSLTGTGAFINITSFHDQTLPWGLPPHPYYDLSPFSLTYGGNGASFGGRGGIGHARHRPADVYMADVLVDLVGGSGGAVGGEIPQQSLAHVRPSGRGGNGGGAIELMAVNDIVLSKSSFIIMDGQAGEPGYRGGGGGSGGAIFLSAIGVINCHGKLSARGGAGGVGVGTGSRGGGGGGGGRIVAFGQGLTWDQTGVSTGLDIAKLLDVSGGAGGLDSYVANSTSDNVNVASGAGALSFSGVVRTASNTAGEPGVLHLVSASGVRYRVDRSKGGAQDTQRCLRMDGSEVGYTNSGVLRGAPFAHNGLSISLPGNSSGVWYARRQQAGLGPETVASSDGTRPDRVTFYVKLGNFPEGTTLANWGCQFALHEYDSNHTFFNSSFERQSGMTGPVGGLSNDAIAMIGVSVVDGNWRHDANFRHTPGAQLPPPKGVFARNVQNERWYKVDIFLDWSSHKYKIRLDDITLVNNQTFNGDAVRRIGLYVYNAATVWWDELFAGTEDTMGFECPVSVANEDVIMDRPLQSTWGPDRLGPASQYWDFQRHESHMSQRSTYTDKDHGGLTFYDGEPHLKYHSDIKFRTPDGDHVRVKGAVWSAAMTYVEGDGPSDLEVELATTIAAGPSGIGGGWAAQRDDDKRGEPARFYWYGEHNTIWPNPAPYVTGGVACCSTSDMVYWRNEGIMFHYVNMSDNVFGSKDLMHAERPKVMYNKNTEQFVMWMHADNGTDGLRFAGVALSNWANGPYTMLHTIRPDGNETVDLTVFYDADTNHAYLARTYFATVSYYLPEPVMQPMWQSVQKNGTTDFALSYHRAFYDAAYDNRDDIYQQRWRLEDKPWLLRQDPWMETLDTTTMKFNLTNTETGAMFIYDPADRGDILAAKLGVTKARDILGQGQPPVETRFKDPTDPANNEWSPSSVPAVKAQSWFTNYLDKNIADNPPHRTTADLLIGVPHMVEERRAKYIAVSRLNENFTDTTGVLRLIEGELENNQDLISILSEYGRFGWDAGDQYRTTYPFDVTGQGAPFFFDTQSDWHDRFHQYYIAENDRFDDFVNFRDRQTNAQGVTDRECPIKHQTCQDKAAECTIIWSQQELLPEAEIQTFTFQYHSFSIALPTVEYENCLDEYRQCLSEYQVCLHDRIPPRV